MPASNWAAKLPHGVSRLEERLSFLRGPIETLQRFLEPGPLSSGPSGMEASPLAKNILTRVFAGTQVFASGFFLTLLFLFFLLVHGDTFLRRVVEILPRFGDKRQAVEIIANSVQFLGSRSDNAGGGGGNGNFQPSSDVPADTSDFEGATVSSGGSDDDIPF